MQQYNRLRLLAATCGPRTFATYQPPHRASSRFPGWRYQHWQLKGVYCQSTKAAQVLFVQTSVQTRSFAQLASGCTLSEEAHFNTAAQDISAAAESMYLRVRESHGRGCQCHHCGAATHIQVSNMSSPPFPAQNASRADGGRVLAVGSHISKTFFCNSQLASNVSTNICMLSHVIKSSEC
jgi:hypothetical protein